MKKKLILILLLSLLYVPIVSASTVAKENIDPSTYIIGKHIFTRHENENYDGVLTTQRIMLASKTIGSNNEADMIIYYKNARGNWINAITGEGLTIDGDFAIEYVDLRNIEENAYTATLLPGRQFNAKIKALAANGEATYETVDNNITAIVKASALPELELTEDNIISSEDSDNIVYAWFEDGTLYYYVKSLTGTSEIFASSDISNMFDNLTALTTLDLSEIDFSEVTVADHVFTNTGALETLTTPKVNASVDIDLDKLMFDEGENSYIKLTSTTPVNTELSRGYYVTFMANDAEFAKVGVLAGSKVAEPLEDPTKEGHTFDVWMKDGQPYNFESPVTSDITLVDSWNAESYVVTFMANGVQHDSKIVAYGHKVAKPATDPVKEGHHLKEWQLNGEEYNFATPVKGSLVITALFEIDEYDVTFDTDGGSPVPEVGKVEYQSTATRPATDPEKEHYDFDNWYLVENGVVAASPYNFSTPVVGNIELKAKYTPKKYTVTFNSNGGSSVAPASIDYLTTVDEPDEPSYEGYNFINWFLVEDEVMSEIPYDFDTPITGPITLKAGWEMKTYAVTFDSNGGSNVSSQTIEHGEVVDEPEDPSKETYDFVAWHLVVDDEMVEAPYDFDTPVIEPITLKAEWVLTKHAVTFDSNGGSAVPTQNITHGETASEPEDPNKETYDFVAWHLVVDDEMVEAPYDFDTPITEPITLKAEWELATYGIAFDSNGGSDVVGQIVDHGSTLSEPDEPTKEGYKFVAWHLVVDNEMVEEAYNFATPVTEEFILKAEWIETPELINASNDACGEGPECESYVYVPELVDGAYHYDIGIIAQDIEQYSGYEIYEKDGTTYTKIAEGAIHDPETIEVAVEPGQRKVYVAKAYITKANDVKVYSNYSNEVVIDHAE